jgi:acyl-CoA thioester hydrolase
VDLQPFSIERRVAFADTDAMGVVHHANYLRYCEEARVAWMRAHDLTHTHYPKTDTVLAVLSYRVWHMKPSTFEDLLRITLQVKNKGVRVRFQYSIYKGDVLIAQAETMHIPVDGDLRPCRPSGEFMKQLEKEPWTETWLLNS